MSEQTALRAAVSSLSAALVDGPARTATVVAASPFGLYLLLEETGGASVDVLPVLTADALALPTAVRLPLRSEELTWPLRTGDTATVGAGAVVLPSLRVDVVRTTRPARVRRVGPHAPPAGDPLELAPHTPPGAAALLALVGRGAGLTPEADDVLAGHLLVGWALGRPAPDLEPELHRTTALSASLLRAAAQGYAVPEAVAYVDAVVAGDRDAVLALRPRVMAIGHSSGPALLRGIQAALYVPPSHPSVERTVA
jgi:hypothetical protein